MNRREYRGGVPYFSKNSWKKNPRQLKGEGGDPAEQKEKEKLQAGGRRNGLQKRTEGAHKQTVKKKDPKGGPVGVWGSAPLIAPRKGKEAVGLKSNTRKRRKTAQERGGYRVRRESLPEKSQR